MIITSPACMTSSASRQANIELMRLGLRTRYVPSRCTLTEVDQQLKAQMVTDPAASVLYQPFKNLQESRTTSISKNVIHVMCEEAQKAILTSVVTGLWRSVGVCGAGIYACCP